MLGQVRNRLREGASLSRSYGPKKSFINLFNQTEESLKGSAVLQFLRSAYSSPCPQYSGSCPAQLHTLQAPLSSATAPSLAHGSSLHVNHTLESRRWVSTAQQHKVETILSDPFQLVKEELNIISDRIRGAISSEIPTLNQAATYFFQRGFQGKQLRPSICLLMSSALSARPPLGDDTRVPDLRPVGFIPLEERRRLQRIAEVVELIHVASLLHDDVIDDSQARRGKPALNFVYGNKIAILAGDFLLARASMTLASLQSPVVTTLMSQVLEDLVSGEVLQATSSLQQLSSMDLYLRKTYLKTASLMANGSRSVAVILGACSETCDAAFEFGKQLGTAFQVLDDILDFTSSKSFLGKPALNDIKSGVITCPVLFAAEEHPDLIPMIQRKFKCAGDLEHAVWCVKRSNAIQRSKALAYDFAHSAESCLSKLGPSPSPHAEEARLALQGLCHKLKSRTTEQAPSSHL